VSAAALLPLCESFVGLSTAYKFAWVHANRMEFSMDCFPKKPSAPPQTPKNAPGCTRSSSA
jgi:hypothetical protein